MSVGPGRVREVVWLDICPWLLLVRTLRIAVSLRVLLLAAIGLVGMTAGWRVVGDLFRGTDDAGVLACIERYGEWPWESTTDRTERIAVLDRNESGSGRGAVLRAGRVETLVRQVPLIGDALVSGPLSRVWRRLVDPAVELFRSDLSLTGLAYLLLCSLWAVVVWAFFGGAITRMAVVSLTRGQPVGLTAAVRHATSAWLAYAWAPLLPVVGAMLAIGLLMVLGLALRLGLPVMIASLVWPVVLLIGLFLTLVLVGLLIGWPLLWPAVATEGADAFDAVSRSYAYALQRPLHYLFYAAMASLLGLVGSVLIGVLCEGVVSLSEMAVHWGWASTERILGLVGLATKGDRVWAAVGDSRWIGFWTDCVTTVRHAFPFGFFWSAASAIYLVLRRDVDATEMDEITLDDEDQVEDFPPLLGDHPNVPDVADRPDDDEKAPDGQKT